MAVAFTNLPWLLWRGKQKEPRISSGSSLNTSSDTGSGDSSDTIKFPFVKRTNMAPSSKRVQRKWQTREERRVDKEYDVVVVPSDGGCVSGSESDGSDWSIGWLEPHGAGFQSDDDDINNSFAVLVPCYGRIHDVVEDSRNNILGTVMNIPDINPDESEKYLQHWLSTLQSS